MASLSATPAALNLACTVANDFTLTLAVTENGSNWSATGATLATSIYDSAGNTVATNFTSSASDGLITLTLTDTQTSTLGVGVYSYRLSVTKSSNTRTWIAGTLSVVEPGVGGRSASASLTVTTSTVTLTLTSLVAPEAGQISVADAGGYYAGTTVESVLAEVATTKDSVARTNRHRYLPTGAIAQSMSRLSCVNYLTITSGRQNFTQIWLPTGTISSITVLSGSTAAVSPTNQWFSLYDSSRNRLAVTADDTTTAWGALTLKTLTIPGGYTVTTEGWYYVGAMVAAATPPSFVCINLVSFAVTSIAPVMAGSDNTNGGLTTPATAPATAAALTASLGSTFYAYVS